jgi:hypothetical protein
MRRYRRPRALYLTPHQHRASDLLSHYRPASAPRCRADRRLLALCHKTNPVAECDPALGTTGRPWARALLAASFGTVRAPLPGRNDPDAARQYRQAIQRRFTELVAEHRAKTDELAQLADDSADAGSPDPGLLAALPQLPLRLCGLPEHVQRLYDAFQLQVRYHRPRHEVTIRVTIRADSLNHINGTVNAIKPQGEREKKTETRSHVVGAPSRIRTCAHGSGGRLPATASARRCCGARILSQVYRDLACRVWSDQFGTRRTCS